MNDTAATGSPNILIGPSYLNGIETVGWRGITANYLKKQRDPSRDDSRYIYYDAQSVKTRIMNERVDRELADVILRLNADTNCFFLAERERTSFFDGAFLAPVSIANYARYVWLTLKQYAPKLIIFHNRPHELFTYVLLKIGLYLNIPTLLVHFSALPWRMAVSRYSVDGSMAKLPVKSSSTDRERDSVRNYMRRLQANHAAAIPFVDSKLISANRRALYFGDELQGIMRGSVTKNVLRIVRKRSLHRAFRGSVYDAPENRYVAFLMHYQPEESTIPRGGIFAQQLNALTLLRSLLPGDISILVKENRATFRAPLTLAMGVRNVDFYQALRSLPSTHLVPLDRDTFELIDNSLAVATITGTVGLEALCRGRKVIVFGDANYNGFSGVCDVNAFDFSKVELVDFIERDGHDPAATEADLLGELLRSLGPPIEDNEINFQSQQDATVEGFEYIAKNINELMCAR